MLNFSLRIFNELQNAVQKVYDFLHLETLESTTGRSLTINPVEAIALALFKQKQNIATKQSLFDMVKPACKYNAFVRSLNCAGKYLLVFVALIIATNRKAAHLVKFTDSTDVPTCLLKNSKYHRTMRILSAVSKTGKGWFYGLKLHLTADIEGRVLAIRFSRGNSDDRGVFKRMNEKLRGLFIADAGYLSEQLQKDFFIDNARLLITATRANMKKIATPIQIALLNARMGIETHFRNLKLFYGLVTSLPRSINGYLTHYLASVCAYLLAS